MLQTPVWTREDMAVAQDWELERGNEGVLLWTDLGPELARMVCEKPDVLGMLIRVVGESKAGALARAEAVARAWETAWVWAGMRVVSGSEVRGGTIARATSQSALWVGLAGAGAGSRARMGIARACAGALVWVDIDHA